MKLKVFLIFLFPLLILMGCEEENDDDTDEATQVTLSFKAKSGDENLVMEKVYTDPNGYSYKIQTLFFYYSEVTLVKNDSSEVLIKDVDYADLYAVHESDSDERLQKVYTIPSGTYTALKFGVGVPVDKNHTDPSSYPNDHPLSIYTGAHWDWSSGYIFSKIEGRRSLNAGEPVANNGALVLHPGTDALYREVTLPLGQIEVINGQNTPILINIDMPKLLANLDLGTENFTHTSGNFALAEKVANNWPGAFSIYKGE